MSLVDIDDFDFCDWLDDTDELINQLRAVDDADHLMDNDDQVEQSVDEVIIQPGYNGFGTDDAFDGDNIDIEHSNTRCGICRLSTDVGLGCNQCYPIPSQFLNDAIDNVQKFRIGINRIVCVGQNFILIRD